MDNMKFETDEHVSDESHQKELVELPLSELERIGGGFCEPGTIDIDK